MYLVFISDLHPSLGGILKTVVLDLIMFAMLELGRENLSSIIKITAIVITRKRISGICERGKKVTAKFWIKLYMAGFVAISGRSNIMYTLAHKCQYTNTFI